MTLQADRDIQVPLFCFVQLMVSLVYGVGTGRRLIKSIPLLLD